ncbi:Uncharacterised protein g8120 [Pycnogonum litorale]
MTFLTGFLYSTIFPCTLDYLFFLLLDVWTKDELRKISVDAKRRHIWKSQAQVLMVASMLVYLFFNRISVVLLSLAFGAYLSSKNLGLLAGVMTLTFDVIQSIVNVTILMLKSLVSSFPPLEKSTSSKLVRIHRTFVSFKSCLLIVGHYFVTIAKILMNGLFYIKDRIHDFTQPCIHLDFYGTERKSATTVKDNSTVEAFLSSVLRLIGLQNRLCMPRGLKNGGLNICFMNSVLQCVSRTPKLMPCLRNVLFNQPSVFSVSPKPREMVDFTYQLYSLLNELPIRDGKVLSPYTFHQSCMELKHLIPMDTQQRQEDVAEFFMWLTNTLHVALNTKLSPQTASGRTSSANEALKKPYQKFSQIHQIQVGDDMKMISEEIACAAHVRWTNHKTNNQSIIDDLFTGQFAEVNRCKRCLRTNAEFQKFQLLSLPVTDCTLHLTDCFQALIQPKTMTIAMNCQCQRSTNNQLPKNMPSRKLTPIIHKNAMASNICTEVPTSPYVNRLQLDSNYPSMWMSPILTETLSPCLNDSSLLNNAKTSTPILISSPENESAETTYVNLTVLTQLPPVLVLQLDRVRWDVINEQQQSIKINHAIDIPLFNLNLNDFVPHKDDGLGIKRSYDYRLYGLCVHVGLKPTNGHFVSYVCDDKNGWYKFDDERVTLVSDMSIEIETENLRKDSYLLFYKHHSLV